ncbi:Amino acid permease [Gaiella occulta]|uniref:Amino acid permease n=1 Tax=Gaiella occulta TaxID=1002870 RepID=A0A7M2YV53_9ACTN|nr:universal stress protein [Gaiella occulta]RDI73479.1 Amino acid permease [Gaiella occulta]
MARKVKGFERTLDGRSLFAVAYDEIGSSIYFALGIVAAQALGLTPVVLLVTGVIFLVVSLSYAEGTAAIPETGGAATFTRRAFNDLWGFVTGWALFLDYLIVIALSAVFLPHYLGAALSAPSLARSPWDVVSACFVIAGIVIVRLIRHTRIHLAALALAGLDIVIQALLVILGLALLFSADTLTDGLNFATDQSWRDIAFALPLAMLAYTGLETVANLAEETREPGRALPRSLFSAIGLVVVVTVLIAVVGASAFPSENGSSALGERWLQAPIVGIVAAFGGELPSLVVDILRVTVGISGAALLAAAATTAISGCTRLAHSMGEHGMLPRRFGRLERRTLVSSEAILATGAIAIVVVIATDVFAGDDTAFLASTYSFGVLLAFTSAQLAVIRLRSREPNLVRPFRARPEVRVHGVLVPLPALVGAPLTFAVWILAMVTHRGARYAGPAWLAAGLVVYALVRRGSRQGLLDDVDPIDRLPPGADFRRILVPMKLGDIGEEMVATAIALAKERHAAVEAAFVVRVPRAFTLEGPLPEDVERRAAESLAEARALGEDNGVEVETRVVRSRSIGHAIVEEATARGADLIVLGSSPRWRRQSRFFSPTVDHVLRHAPCEVLVVAFPDGVFDEPA